MKLDASLPRWRELGWKDPFWELLRFYCSLRGNEQKQFLKDLAERKSKSGRWWELLKLTDNAAILISDYCKLREKLLEQALQSLRTEEEAIKFCDGKAIKWAITKTKSKDHHQSSKALIATVSAIAKQVCATRKESIDANPQKRAVWCINNQLHVTARNLDGAIPSLSDPYIVWEIKEYWGKTKGGSKMSDAVYECHLVGREIREYEEKTKHRISHVVFLDGKHQWNARKSDLARFIDLYYQGLIDYLFIGDSVERDWELLLKKLIFKGNN